MKQEASRPNEAELPESAARFRDIPKLNYSIDEACHAGGIGRSTLCEAISAGELETLKIGKRRLVPVAALERWLAGKGAA